MMVQAELTERESFQAQSALLGHELRNPLAVILGNADYLLRTATQPDRRESLTDIHIGAERALMILDAFLRPSDAECAEPVSLQAACRQVRKQFSHRPIHLEFEGDPAPARGEQVEQVLQNLISNADKYTPEGLPITISVSRSGQNLLISVSDRGAGIPLEEQANVFQYRYRMKKHQGITGTGLGLIVCRQLVKGWSGDIWYESRAGFGATFCFTVPVWEPDARRGTDKTPLAAGHRAT
jgi:two-component system sensor histidine kinase KdpD